MIKQSIISQVASKFNQMGITYQTGNGTDIAVFTKFLDAGWSTGSNKITYEALIFADEASSTVFMWEMTKEELHGLSFGGESGTSFQSGRTLFRKVKSVQYGPDGKAYEYTLDIGAISKAVKETAIQHGWRFKTVLRRDKASWPTGYVPSETNTETVRQSLDAYQQEQPQDGSFCINCGWGLAPDVFFCPNCGTRKQEDRMKQQDKHARQSSNGQQPQHVNYQPEQQPYIAQPSGGQGYNPYGNKQGPFYANAQQKSSGKGGTFGLIGFILLGILLIAILAAGKATPAGWILSTVVFAAAFFVQRKLSKKGCLLNLVLWIIAGFILLVILTAVTTESVSFTTAKLKNAHMTTAMDQSGKPVDKVSAYPPSAPELVAVAELRNAPSNTKVKFVWFYVTSNVNIAEYTVDSGDRGTDIYVFSTLTNDKPWPEGEYKVQMYIEDKKTPDATVVFVVRSDAGKSLTSNASTQPATAGVHSAAFRIDYLSYGMWPSITYKSDSGFDMNLGTAGDILFSIHANPAAFSNPDDKVSKITVAFNLLKPPSFGTVKLYRFRPDLAMAPNRPSDMKKYGLPMTFDLTVTDNTSDCEKPENYLISYDNFTNYGQVRIYYCIEDLMPIDPSITSWMDGISAAVSKGINSDALRSNIGIELLIIMKSGEKHRIYFEREMMQGDFFSKTRLNNTIEDYQGKETPIFSEKAP